MLAVLHRIDDEKLIRRHTEDTDTCFLFKSA